MTKVTLESLAATLDTMASLFVEGLDELRNDLRSEMAAGFEQVHVKIGGLQEDVKTIKLDIAEMQKDISEIKVDLKAHGKAIDKDAISLLDHERRIRKLETAR